MRKLYRDQEGQAIVEYILGLVITVGVVSAVVIGIKRPLFSLWETFAKEISAACPGCPPEPKVRIR